MALEHETHSSVNGCHCNNLEIKILLCISLVVITTKFSVLVTYKTSTQKCFVCTDKSIKLIEFLCFFLPYKCIL